MEAEGLGKLLQSLSEELCCRGLVEQHKVQDEQNDDETRTPQKVHISEFF
jgi:hypothetical protein